MTGFELLQGVTIHVKFTYANTANNPTLSVNSSTAVPIVQYGTTPIGGDDDTSGWKAGAVIALTYDGTSWVRDQGYNSDTHCTVEDSLTSTSTTNALSAAQGKTLKDLIDGMDATTPSASGTATSFITSITQTDGRITDISKKTIPDASTSTKGIVKLGTTSSTAAAGNHTHTTESITRPLYKAGNVGADIAIQPLVNDLRANHLAFLPADQIIIEKTTDGGTTWVDAGISDVTKAQLFAELRPGIAIPQINGEKNILCGLRVTFTAMKYNVPENTPETSKYNYWSSTYVGSTERYNNIQEFYFWLDSGADKINIKVERAKGSYPNNWEVCFDDNTALFQGWSGNDYVRISSGTFGGSTGQTGNYWNYRITFMSAYNSGATAFSASYITGRQSINEIRAYGSSFWTRGNQYASSDHLYSWDINQHAYFPADVRIKKLGLIYQPSSTRYYGFLIPGSLSADHYYTFPNKDGTVAMLSDIVVYTHPTGDGNLHVPATGTTNNGNFLKAGATAGSISWATLVKADISDFAHDHGNITNTGNIDVTSGWALGDGDGFVIYDASNSNKMEKSGIVFDCTTETKGLTPKGTWVNYAGGTLVTLNGTAKGATTASFYAPTSAGSLKQLLVSTGGAPDWLTNTIGDKYTPTYVNQGVLMTTSVTQKKSFTISANSTEVTLTDNAFNSNTYVLEIVVTSGEAGLHGPIEWESFDADDTVVPPITNSIKLTTATTSQNVVGYIITARGETL